jgi:hypothetical protein
MAYLPACERAVGISHLFGLTVEGEARAAREAGLASTWSDLRRNSDGSRLYCFFPFQKRVLVVSDAGKTALDAPGLVAFLDDDGRFVAWSDDVTVGFHLAGGNFIGTAWSKDRSGKFGVDPSGQYFFWAREPRRTIVADIEAPDVVLGESAFEGEAMYYQNGSLYLLGRVFDDSLSFNREIFADVFQFRDRAWQRVRSIRIPRGREAPSPFAVVDMEPWSERVLLIDVRDPPFSSRYYLYDLASGTRLRAQVPEEPVVFLKTDLTKALS